MRIYFIVFILTMLAASCSDKEGKPSSGRNSDSINNIVRKVPEMRVQVNDQPVAQFVERTDNPLNEWYFSVKIFETPKTFHYLIKLNFEEIQGEDSLKLPDFGTPPQPVIQKGTEKYSCIIGFLDSDNKFREYKKVYVKGNALKITALKHYSVRTKN